MARYVPRFSYAARFADGTQIERQSDRTYTHAWRIAAVENGKPDHIVGFAGSAALAQRAVDSWKKQVRSSARITSTEVVAVTEGAK